ncbi:probable malate dehydrogenase, mitochondrial [Copidosoma floridanum]|uniref:probable malate dehydrogenase, mitochondrial n=1 Tax=Copidosoma floridanum TaxID=29053 RepID=UPI0006C9C52C|nr:probable malate dehydrogenase, mitochondrial [Copidosoma floridanum]
MRCLWRRFAPTAGSYERLTRGCKSLSSSGGSNEREGEKSSRRGGKRAPGVDCRRSTGDLSVAVVGGGCSALCATILLKQNPAIREIRVVDTDDSLAAAVCDIRQIDTSTMIRHFEKESILEGTRNCHIVALMDETDFTLGSQGPFGQFAWSASYVKSTAECMLNSCPRALIAVFARPVTATLPLVHEVFRYSGDWDPNRIVGSAALETMRVIGMAAAHLNLDPACLTIPMAGGVDSSTVVPLLSRIKPLVDFSDKEHCKLVGQVRSTDQELCESEARGPTLSSGVAAAKFVSTLVNGLKNRSISVASAYVRSDALPGCKYATSEIKFGPRGVEKNYGLPRISPREVALVERAAPLINEIGASAEIFFNTGKIK